MHLGKRCVVMLTVLAGALVSAQGAAAATPLGQTFAPSGSCGNITFLQTESDGNIYTVPTAGVITRWSFQSGANSPLVKLKVARPTGGSSYRILGESPLAVPAANTTNTYSDVRISVQPGDIIGMYVSNTGDTSCAGIAPAVYKYVGAVGDVPPAPTAASFSAFSGAGTAFDIAAVLEPDADGDGYGDETQDGCPTDATASGPCPDKSAPNTLIDSGPLKKTSKRKAKFNFSSSEAGSDFECKLDKEPFDPCASPFSVKVNPGKHQLQVRAIDSAGNADPTPGSYRWKVKPKKK